MSRILSVDPSPGNTGYAFAIDGTIVEAYFNELDESPIDGDRLVEGRKWFEALLARLTPDLIVIEAYFFSAKFPMQAGMSPKIRGVFEMVARQNENKIPYLVVPPSHWKKVVAGRATATPAQKKKWKTTANKKFIIEALETRHGLKFPKTLKNPKSGRVVKFRYDVSDAIGILIAHFLDTGVQYNLGPDLFDPKV